MKRLIVFIVVLLMSGYPSLAHSQEKQVYNNFVPSTLYFEGTKDFQMWQGVASDGEYIYTMSDRDENFNLSNIISVFTMDGKFIKEKPNAYTGTINKRFMSFGDGRVINGYLYITAYDFNGGSASLPVEERNSKILKYNTMSLNLIDEFTVGNGTAESIDFYNNSYWIVFHDKNVISRYDTEFQLIKDYPLSRDFEKEGGYQGIIFKDNELFVNLHGSNEFGQEYAYGLDHYHFDGTSFVFVERIKPPVYGAGQGIDNYGEKYFWADRPGNRIIITNTLDVGKLQVLEQDKTLQIVVPTLTNGWKIFDVIYDRKPRIWKDENNIVHLEGIMCGGNLQQAAFTLPPGFRPKTSKNFLTISNDKFARIAIIGNKSSSGVERAGEVIVMIGDSTWVSLDGLTFLAEE